MTKGNFDFTTTRVIKCLTEINFRIDKPIDKRLTDIASRVEDEASLTANVIENNDLNKREKADICFELFLTKREPCFIFKAGNLASQYDFIAWVVKSLLDNEFDSAQVRTQIEHKWDQETTRAFFNNLKIIKQDLELFGELIPQSKINQFYQVEKTYSNSVLQAPEAATGWYKNQTGIEYKQATEIGQFKGGKLYGYVAPKFSETVWHDALGKGFSKTAEGTNGVKFLKGRLLELKINDGTRLYTKVVHKNDLGDFLAIFNEEANHAEIKNIINSKVLKKGIFIDEECHTEATYGPDGFTDIHLDLTGDLSHGKDFNYGFSE